MWSYVQYKVTNTWRVRVNVVVVVVVVVVVAIGNQHRLLCLLLSNKSLTILNTECHTTMLLW